MVAAAITGAILGTPLRYTTHTGHALKGDIWDAAWADDGRLYIVIDDISEESGAQANLAIAVIDGDVPPDIHIGLVNMMPQYGKLSELGADGACWKANGITSIDGVLYLSVSRHWYGHVHTDGRQTAGDASIVISRDHGQTWAPEPSAIAQPFAAPLFPGANFATPFFIKYGQDGMTPTPAPDEADRYVYAISTDGFWDNGNAMQLGRVARTDLAQLHLEDWEFYVGSDAAIPQWSRGQAGLDAAQPVLQAPHRCGQAGAQYIASLNRYLMAQWSYPDLKGPTGEGFWEHPDLTGPAGKDFAVGHSVWEWYEAPHPWGPWTMFQHWDWPTEGFYNPSLPAKFISADGTQLWALTTGDFRTSPFAMDQTRYTLHLIPAAIHIAARNETHKEKQ